MALTLLAELPEGPRRRIRRALLDGRLMGGTWCDWIAGDKHGCPLYFALMPHERIAIELLPEHGLDRLEFAARRLELRVPDVWASYMAWDRLWRKSPAKAFSTLRGLLEPEGTDL